MKTQNVHVKHNQVHNAPTRTAVVWTNGPTRETILAVHLLKKHGITVEQRNIQSPQWTKAQLLAAYPTVTKLPHIVVDQAVIGTFKDLVANAEFKPKPAAAPVKVRIPRVSDALIPPVPSANANVTSNTTTTSSNTAVH